MMCFLVFLFVCSNASLTDHGPPSPPPALRRPLGPARPQPPPPPPPLDSRPPQVPDNWLPVKKSEQGNDTDLTSVSFHNDPACMKLSERVFVLTIGNSLLMCIIICLSLVSNLYLLEYRRKYMALKAATERVRK